MRFPTLCATALAALTAATPGHAVVYHFEYSGSPFSSPPDPVEGRVYTVDRSRLSMSVHESLLHFTDSSTATLTWGYNGMSDRSWLNGILGRTIPGFTWSADMFVHHNEVSLTFNTQTLQVTDWNIATYEEYFDEYYSTPLRRGVALYLGEKYDLFDEDIGEWVDIDYFMEKHGLTEYMFSFNTPEPASWTVSRSPPLAPITPSPIPLPAGLPLLATSLFALGLWR